MLEIPLSAFSLSLSLSLSLSTSSPYLTWRDVQYLLVYTANRNKLVNGGWVTNGAGLHVSSKFGFGAVDAEALVSRGRHWINVPDQVKESYKAPFDPPSPHNPFAPSGESCCDLTRSV